MKTTIRTLALIAALSGSAIASHAQTITVYEDNYNGQTPGSGFPAWNWANGACTHQATYQDIGGGNIVVQRLGIINNTGGSPANTRFGSKWDITLSGNTSANPADYTISFDLRSVSGNWDPMNLEFFVLTKESGGDFGRGSGISGYSQAAGWVHVERKLSDLPAGWWQGTGWVLTNPRWSIEIGGPAWPGTPVGPGESWEQVWQMDNLKITMAADVPPPPPPTLTAMKAKPGLRIFAANYDAPWNMQGFGTVDSQQSWVGRNNASYSVTFDSWNTVPGFQFQTAFVPNNYMNTAPNVPWVVWSGSNACVWTITKRDTYYDWSLAWKTNGPTGGAFTTAFSASTSTDAVGKWTLTFTSDTDGTVTAPDGSNGSFSLPPEVAEQFADPLTVIFGIQPWSTAGYGQYLDIRRITITNVAGVNVDDDFTMDDGFNTGLWDTGFSVDQGSVVQVSTNTPFWVTWTVPDFGFGLGTKADLGDTQTPWYSPTYWNSVTPPTRQMGPSLKWALIPKACLPTVEGTPGGTPSPVGFFRLSNPSPSQ